MADDLKLLMSQVYGQLNHDTQEQPALCVHTGHSYVEGPDLRARELIDRGGSLDWVTISCPPVDMWDLHVGILFETGGEVTVGIHVHDDADSTLSDIAHELGPSWGEYGHSMAAREKQWNKPITAESRLDEVISREALRLSRHVLHKLHASGA